MSQLHVLVLGAAAGGGLPQWNCACEVCQRARRGDAVTQATQASIAVSDDGLRWFLVNASPDLRQQIVSQPALRPRESPRDTPISGVVLTNGDVDAIAGLLTLREGSPFTIWAHPKVLDVLDTNSIFDVVPRERVPRQPITPSVPFGLTHSDGSPSGLVVEAFSVPGKVPLYAEAEQPPELLADGDTLGLSIRQTATGKAVLFVGACAAMTPSLRDRLHGADLVFFDGTLWRDDEMIAAGLSHKTGRRMGHMSMSGDSGVIASLADLQIARKIFIHVNNSNPVWIADSPEQILVRQAGWDIAHDGLEITL